jgi:hypothetical protein
LERLEGALASAGLQAEDAALIAEILQLPLGERYPALTLTPDQKRRRLLTPITARELATNSFHSFQCHTNIHLERGFALGYPDTINEVNCSR